MPPFNCIQNIDSLSDVCVRWKQMREYPLYEVSNTGRFRTLRSGAEVDRSMVGTTSLYHSIERGWEVVCAWTMANRYFYNNQRTKRIAETSCLARL